MIKKAVDGTYGISNFLSRGFVGLIKCYQFILAPLLGPRCRFYPSCSRYALSCLELYTFHIAMKKISCRLLKCQPWHPGGVDLP